MLEDNVLTRLFKDIVGIKLQTKIKQAQTDYLILDELCKFKNIFTTHEDQMLISYPYDVRQLHIFYVTAILLDNFNSTELKLKRSEFTKKIYLPNLNELLNKELTLARNIFKNINIKIYAQINEQSKSIIDFFLIFYSLSKETITTDILSLFCRGLLLEADPLDVGNVKEYYTKIFKYLYFSYLKNRSVGLLDYELTPDFIDYDDELVMISRDNIYETGLRVTQTRELCIETDTLTAIKNSYVTFKKNIFPNEIQKLYSQLILKKEITDTKTLLMQTYVDTEELNFIRKKLPLILQILRSIHIRYDESLNLDPSFKNVDRTHVKNELYGVIYTELLGRLNDHHASVIANSISISLTNNLVNGIYIDPITMSSLNFDIQEFLIQFKKLLILIFQKYEV